MKIKVIFLGKTKEKYLVEGIADYVKRLKRYVKVEIVTLKEKRKNKNEQLTIIEEGRQLLASCGDKSFLIALDPNGVELDSREFSRKIGQWEQKSIQSIVFLIGGHLGLSTEVKSRADLMLSLSKLTFTHEMARLLLIEQLYRGFSIKSGSKYHK